MRSCRNWRSESNNAQAKLNITNAPAHSPRPRRSSTIKPTSANAGPIQHARYRATALDRATGEPSAVRRASRHVFMGKVLRPSLQLQANYTPKRKNRHAKDSQRAEAEGT